MKSLSWALSLLFVLIVFPLYAQSAPDLIVITTENAADLHIVGSIPNPIANIQALDMAWSPDSQRIALSTGRGVVVYDLTPDGLRRTLDVRQSAMRCVTFSPDGRLIASCDSDGVVWLWDAQTGERAATVAVTPYYAENARFSPNGKILLTDRITADYPIDAWAVRINGVLQPFTPANAFRTDRWYRVRGTEYVSDIEFHPEGSTFGFASIETGLEIRDSETGESVLALTDGKVYDLAFSGDGLLVAVMAEDNTVRVLNTTTYEAIWEIRSPTCREMCVIGLSPAGDVLALAYLENFVRLFSTLTGERLAEIPGQDIGGSVEVEFSPDGTLLAFLEGGKGITLWGFGGELPLLPDPTATAAPTLTPEPTATPAVLTIGGSALVTSTKGDNLNLRSGAGANFELVARLAPGTRVDILDGPQEAGGYRWWKVRTADGLEGWVVEFADEQTLTPVE